MDHKVSDNSKKSIECLYGKIAFPLQKGFRFEDISDIQYIIANGSYSKVYFRNQKQLLVSKNLKFYELKLWDREFMRIHPSTLINFNYIKELDRSEGGSVIMQDGKQLPISRQKRLELEALIRENS
ncbi:hypothetical protein GCM10011344_28720 [Dokdonia pacifica]|uniref:LytTr DNA-binding domain-containing protein n=1 Tax=Dokdonia pacifica TaxID=1627892 RepID=A0A239C939_9FLAO|nr:LytTR family DNA-binding domain-containing protein [Dokdonia pacifica]GGG26254.1 hypothetical protein GCM10011344_28720 [Dokdonia pacifica]SNS16178.1 LytTr DNA-binding domain-containing protein [Dokdonia pacifica]